MRHIWNLAGVAGFAARSQSRAEGRRKRSATRASWRAKLTRGSRDGLGAGSARGSGFAAEEFQQTCFRERRISNRSHPYRGAFTCAFELSDAAIAGAVCRKYSPKLAGVAGSALRQRGLAASAQSRLQFAELCNRRAQLFAGTRLRV